MLLSGEVQGGACLVVHKLFWSQDHSQILCPYHWWSSCQWLILDTCLACRELTVVIHGVT